MWATRTIPARWTGNDERENAWPTVHHIDSWSTLAVVARYKEAEDLETLSPDAAPLRPFLLSTRHSVANLHRRHHHDYRQKIPGAKLRDCEA